MEWLKCWTGGDQVALRKKRLISRFRTDSGQTALYVSFRLHIPRSEMRYPPDHGPYSHEVSHGYLNFPALCPTGRYGEGLAEVGRVSYWWFLGLEDAHSMFIARSIGGFKRRLYEGGSALRPQSYSDAAAVYLVLLDRFCRTKGNSPDWFAFSELFRLGKRVSAPKDASEEMRFRIFSRLCSRAFGSRVASVMESMGIPAK